MRHEWLVDWYNEYKIANKIAEIKAEKLCGYSSFLFINKY